MWRFYRDLIIFLRPFSKEITNFALVGPGHGKLKPITPVANSSNIRVPSVPAKSVDRANFPESADNISAKSKSYEKSPVNDIFNQI